MCCLESHIKNNFLSISSYMKPTLYTDVKYKNLTPLSVFNYSVKITFACSLLTVGHGNGEK